MTAVSANRTTSSSNAVVVSSKGKISNQSSDHHHAGPSRGFLEEDENEERKAALSSPIKGGKRLSSAVSTHLFIQSFLTNNVLGYCQTWTHDTTTIQACRGPQGKIHKCAPPCRLSNQWRMAPYLYPYLFAISGQPKLWWCLGHPWWWKCDYPAEHMEFCLWRQGSAHSHSLWTCFRPCKAFPFSLPVTL